MEPAVPYLIMGMMLFSHRLRVPWEIAEPVRNQLLTHMPGVTSDPRAADDVAFTVAVELGLRGSDLPLRIPDPVVVSSSILGAMRSLTGNEQLHYQWVVAPSRIRRPPAQPKSLDPLGVVSLFIPTKSKEIMSDLRGKLDEPNYDVILRIGATAQTESRARFLISNLRSVLQTVSTIDTGWVIRSSSTNKVSARINGGCRRRLKTEL